MTNSTRPDVMLSGSGATEWQQSIRAAIQQLQQINKYMNKDSTHNGAGFSFAFCIFIQIIL